MKALGLLLTALLLAGSAAAQTAAPEPHGVSVVKARWQKRFYNPALDEDPLRAANDSRRLDRERRETQRTNTILTQLGRDRLPVPAQPKDGTAGIPENEARNFYLYEVKLSNNGAKKIRSLVWEYVLFDAATQQEVGRHAFESKAGIGAGKSKSLSGLSTSPAATLATPSSASVLRMTRSRSSWVYAFAALTASSASSRPCPNASP